MIIYTNKHFELVEENNKVYCNTYQTGFPLKEFDTVLRSNPRIRLTNFAVLKNVLSKISEKPVEIGEWLPNITVEVSRDKMSASVLIFEPVEYIRLNKEQLTQDIEKLLSENGIVHGIVPFPLDLVMPGKAMLVAHGSPPVKGADAKVSYLEIPERKPVIGEDGKADYYDMNFIFEITEGSWLGEKIPAQPGVDGHTVYGEVIPAPAGRDLTLKYDKKSAYEVEEDGKTVIRSKISGVLEQNQGQISVNHHLPIQGDVGVETGNINFEGSISIRGTVQHGFSVVAKGDISIEGLEGVSGAKLIKSTDGDIYIRGGIFGLGETRVEAGGSIFVKHVNEANLIAGQDINIGFYAMSSYLKGQSILVDERKGKIIGGTAIAKSQIVTAISGNRLERRTELIINTIDKQEAYTLIHEKAAKLKALHEEVLVLEEQIHQLTPIIDRLNDQQKSVYENAKVLLNQKREEATAIDHGIKEIMDDLRSAVREEITVKKEAYPGTFIKIGKKSSILTKMTSGTFKIEFDELNV